MSGTRVERQRGMVERAASGLRLTEGQLYTIVIGAVLAVALLASTLPPVLDARDAAASAQTTSTGADGEQPVAAGPVKASRQGVTDDAVKVGVMLLDLSSVEPLGLALENYEVETQQAAFDTYFAELNANGGINGRQIEPVYAARDSLATSGPNSDEAICIRMAKDEKVFAFIGYTDKAGICATNQYGIPSIQNGLVLSKEYERAGYGILSLNAAHDRVARNWARVLVESGVVDDHKIGLISYDDGGADNVSAKVAEQELADLGHPLEMHVELSASGGIGDLEVAVKKMKDAGVDQVMFATAFITVVQFVAFAEGENYYPQYLTSDMGALASNGLVRGAGDGFDGAIGFTGGTQTSASTTTQLDQDCLDRYNDATDGEDFHVGDEQPVITICSIVRVFGEALKAAGPDPTQRGLVTAWQALDITELAGIQPGSFGPAKTDFADGLQPVRFSSECHCYEPAGDPILLDPEED